MSWFTIAGLILYMVYTPTFLVILNSLRKRYTGYSVVTHWISNLGDPHFKYNKTFNVAIIIYGILSIFLAHGLKVVFPDHLLTTTMTNLFYLVTLGILICGIFPIKKYLIIHHVASYLIFIPMLILTVASGYLITLSDNFPNIILILNGLIIVSAIMYAGYFASLFSKLKRVPITPIEVYEISDSWLARTAGLWEWTSFILCIFYCLVLSCFVLVKIVV